MTSSSDSFSGTPSYSGTPLSSDGTVSDATVSDVNAAANPLLATTGLPQFDRIEPAHVIPAVRTRLAEANAKFEELERDVSPTWERTIAALDELDRPFEYCWQPVSHLFGVRNSPELREAYETVLPEMIAFGLKVRQSRPMYEALRELRDGKPWAELDEAQQRIVERRLLDAQLAGIGLDDEQRKEFNRIAEDLSAVGTKFSNHVLDATKAFSLIVGDPGDVEGLPESLLRLAVQSYNDHRSPGAPEATMEAGPWRFTLDTPSYGPFMEHCRNRDLREKMYRAFITRASEAPNDNSPLIRRILTLRQRKAELLGFENFAQLSLATKMAPSQEAVEDLLERLRASSWPHAERDLEDLCSLARDNDVHDPLMHWDLPFWAERLREQRFQFTDEELRPYFPFERVLNGLFSLCERLFGVTFEPADGEASVWNKDVRFFHVKDERGERIASFYLDPYSRPENKRGGAWMDDCFGRRVVDGKVHHPIAHLVCNQTPPAGGRPSLMSFREVETLFHEFGHGLQHMLTRIAYASAAGINNVEWDAVELPSQFMENWCYHESTLIGMTGHYQTGEPLPIDLFRKIVAARTFRAGTAMLRQLQFSITDLRLHSDYDPAGEKSPFDLMREVSEQTGVMPMLPENRFLCEFQHIFSGGYAAGYYSYKWAEVLAADAFSAFEEVGLENEAAVRDVGRRFRETVLACGGGRHPLMVFEDFRGRGPRPEPLLNLYGLASSQDADTSQS